ncbi:MAG: TetR/AcrR family transcriptional regulator [Actinomycetota bacterium]
MMDPVESHVTPGRAGDGPENETGRAPLTRRRILSCALDLIDRDGLETLSMRRLAAELDVTAMSLYNHVASKEELLEGVTEALLGEIDLTVVAIPDWAQGLKAGFRSFRRALLDHPHALPLIQSKPAVSPDAFRPIELSLATLRRGGFSPKDAIEAHWLLVGFTLGHVGFQLSNPLCDPARADAEMLRRYESLPADDFPNLLESLPFAVGSDFGAAYDFGLETIIEGLRARLASDYHA